MPNKTKPTPGLIDPHDPSFAGWVEYMLSLPKQADDSAEIEFPDSARDSSVKNAYRHSLGSGLLAQELGASEGGLRGVIAQALAKSAGYAWELAGLKRNITDRTHRTDTQHDLNANAIGIIEAAMSNSKDDLAERLKQRALQSVPAKPPSPFEPSPGYMTHTAR